MRVNQHLSRKLVVSLLPLLVSCANVAQPLPSVHPSLNASNSRWDEASQTLTITQSVTFANKSVDVANDKALDEVMEDFYWTIPKNIKKVVIGENVTVTGHFRFSDEQVLTGQDRFTSRIFGTNTKAWARGLNQKQDKGTTCARNGKPGAVAGDDRIHDCQKWQYGGVSVESNAPVKASYTIKNLTIENPRTYAITAIRHRMIVDGVNIINTRPYPDYQSNSDGIGGGPGSRVTNTYIDTWDDSIKLYKDGMHVENVTIIHNPNGSPFQLGWGNKKPANFTLKNIKVIQAKPSKRNRFNLALFANSGGKIASTVNIDGFIADYESTAILNKCGENQVMPFAYISNPQSTLTLNVADNAALQINAPAKVCGKGKVLGLSDFNAKQAVTLKRGNIAKVTGCLQCEPK
ncbi:hypothetical protein C2869_07580 [Saccharobesus litoralis]|uniref:Uncharacterized protein n=1 Tax=Saccharobesus litoralis TaxID=2172099 RepID=A0A2S0VQ05_9ALTE|nr:hypothetical protein [Saccharobesus litoralis]AWB66301.1 hypothetical protein C2869_07580 [Saccharobesus litoralis]